MENRYNQITNKYKMIKFLGWISHLIEFKICRDKTVDFICFWLSFYNVNMIV